MFKKFILQLFAEEQDPPTDSPTDPPAKQFTQSEVDEIVKKRLERHSQKYEKDFKESDDYKNYQKYLDDKKTSDEKIQEQLKGIEDLKGTNKSLQAELDSYKNKALLENQGVNKEFSDYVLFEVKKLVNDNKDFSEAFEEFKKVESNKKYFGEQDTKGITTGQRHKQQGTDSVRAKSILDNLGYGKQK